jgi:hypothetical protein
MIPCSFSGLLYLSTPLRGEPTPTSKGGFLTRKSWIYLSVSSYPISISIEAAITVPRSSPQTDGIWPRAPRTRVHCPVLGGEPPSPRSRFWRLGALVRRSRRVKLGKVLIPRHIGFFHHDWRLEEDSGRSTCSYMRRTTHEDQCERLDSPNSTSLHVFRIAPSWSASQCELVSNRLGRGGGCDGSRTCLL